MPARKNRSKSKQIKKPSRLNILTATLLIGGAVLVLAGGLKQYLTVRSLTPGEAVNQGVMIASVAAKPIEMQIADKVAVTIEGVKPAAGNWPVSPVGANYVLNSAQLGEAGNLIIYGHNRKQILGGLKQVAVGDRVRLTDQYGKEWVYRVVKTFAVSPGETKWLEPTDTPVLTIYTCTGWLDSQRLIVRAIPTL